MKNLGKLTGATDASIKNKMEVMEDRVSGIEDKKRGNSYLSKKILNLKSS